jgi:ornithine--oxo-acid transaminase
MSQTVSTRTDEFLALESQYSARNYAPLDVVIESAQGAWVTDVDGRRYLDCLSAYSALNQGHCHPRIVAALVEQASRVTLTSRAFRNDQFGPFCAELCRLMGYEQVLLMNTGAEAVETALKTARKWGYKIKGVPANQAEIIVCSGNFHGRTISIVSFSTEEQYRDGFGPFTPGFTVVPYGDLAALKAAINPNTVAFLVEPIQGEGGVIVPPAGYLRGAYDLCRANHVLFMADEIQTGLGRTGKWLACEHEDVRPDVAILGKALGGGLYPVSAVLAASDVMGVYNPGDHGSTFGGNPLASAVGRMALRVLSEEGLIENSHVQGEYFQERLAEIPSKIVKEVRGRGLLIGVELHHDAGGARHYCHELADRGLLCKDTHEDVIRFAPPLVITREEIDWALERIAPVLQP